MREQALYHAMAEWEISWKYICSNNNRGNKSKSIREVVGAPKPQRGKGSAFKDRIGGGVGNLWETRMIHMLYIDSTVQCNYFS